MGKAPLLIGAFSVIAKLHEDPFPALGAGRLGGGVKDYEANYNCNWWCHNQRDLIYYKIMLLHKVYDIISPFHINTSLKLQASSATNKFKPSFK